MTRTAGAPIANVPIRANGPIEERRDAAVELVKVGGSPARGIRKRRRLGARGKKRNQPIGRRGMCSECTLATRIETTKNSGQGCKPKDWPARL